MSDIVTELKDCAQFYFEEDGSKSTLPDGVLRHKAADEILSLRNDLAFANRPWIVSLDVVCPTHGHERMEAKVIDIGHADRILLCESEEVNKLITKLRDENSKLKAGLLEVDPGYCTCHVQDGSESVCHGDCSHAIIKRLTSLE